MSSCVLGAMPVSGDMPVVWRMAPGLSGQIRCWLVVFLLAAVLPRTEPEAEGRDAAGDSVNKALVVSLVSVMGDGKLPLSGCGGSERRKMQAEAACSEAGLCEDSRMHRRQSVPNLACSSPSIFSPDIVAERRRSPGGFLCGDGEAVSATPVTGLAEGRPFVVAVCASHFSFLPVVVPNGR